MRWTPDIVAELAALLEDHSWAGAARILGERHGSDITWAQVRYAAQHWGFSSSSVKDKDAAPPVVAQYSTFWRLSGDWALVGDLHCPCTDWGLAGQVGAEARKAGIRQLLICGDVFDMPALGKYAPVVPPNEALAEERAAKYALRMWERTFDTIRILTGNHDLRLFKALQGALGEAAVTAALLARMGADERTEWSVYGYCIIESGTGDWRISHPFNYSRNALTVARKLAAKHLQHVVTFHEHHTAVGFDDSGRFVIANVGCLADPEKLAYKQLVDRSSTPEMSQGFALLKGGRIHCVPKHEAVW